MEQFIIRLSAFVGRPVIDRTGLTGDFDLDLSYTPESPARGAIGVPADGPSIFTALQEQLGLKLESQEVRSMSSSSIARSSRHRTEHCAVLSRQGPPSGGPNIVRQSRVKNSRPKGLHYDSHEFQAILARLTTNIQM